MRDTAREFDHLQPALDIALGVGDDLAVLRGEQDGELVHILLDQLLIFEHHARAALRVGGGPGGLRLVGGVHRALQIGGRAEADARLHLAGIGIENVAEAGRGRAAAARNEVIELAHRASLLQTALRQRSRENRWMARSWDDRHEDATEWTCSTDLH